MKIICPPPPRDTKKDQKRTWVWKHKLNNYRLAAVRCNLYSHLHLSVLEPFFFSSNQLTNFIFVFIYTNTQTHTHTHPYTHFINSFLIIDNSLSIAFIYAHFSRQPVALLLYRLRIGSKKSYKLSPPHCPPFWSATRKFVKNTQSVIVRVCVCVCVSVFILFKFRGGNEIISIGEDGRIIYF